MYYNLRLNFMMLSTYVPMTRAQSDAVRNDVNNHIVANGQPHNNLTLLWWWMRAYNQHVQNRNIA